MLCITFGRRPLFFRPIHCVRQGRSDFPDLSLNLRIQVFGYFDQATEEQRLGALANGLTVTSYFDQGCSTVLGIPRSPHQSPALERRDHRSCGRLGHAGCRCQFSGAVRPLREALECSVLAHREIQIGRSLKRRGYHAGETGNYLNECPGRGLSRFRHRLIVSGAAG